MPNQKSSIKNQKSVIEVDGRKLKLSNLDKVMYPDTGFTKGQVIDYYARAAPALLPHLADRPITLVRYPDGVEDEHFFSKNCPRFRPDWMDTKKVQRESRGGGTTEFCLVNDEAALIWVANLASLELHPYLHREQDIDRPTMLVLDFDPGPERGLKECAKLALAVRDLLAHLKLECVAKTSGGKGLHLAVPLNTKISYDQTKPFAQSLAKLFEQRDPEQFTSNMSKAKRGGRIFIDWSQNDRHKTTVGVYSLRARAAPSVSMPLTWDEVTSLSRSRKRDPIDMSPKRALDRIQKHGDLFDPVLKYKQKLPKFDV